MLPRSLRPVARSSACPRPLLRPQLAPRPVLPVPRRSYATPPGAVVAHELKKTPLFDVHAAWGGKMVPFAGYEMPVTYEDQGLADSHNWVRKNAGLFDVSHMVQHRFEGSAALEFLQKLTPSDLTLLKPYHSTLSVFLHPMTGGIVDDLIITMQGPDSFYVVTNGATAAKDLEYIREHLDDFAKADDVKHTILADRALIALQGPFAHTALEALLSVRVGGGNTMSLEHLYFGSAIELNTRYYGPLHIARGGYTGEDGFEISIKAERVESMVVEMLEKIPQVKLAGLGARDSLRLEAGMCLYGHDLDDNTTPIEAGLKWLVGKRRVMEGGFLGHETVSRQYNDWSQVPRRRVGFIVEGAPAREGAELLSAEGQLIGRITSGCPSPTLGKNIAMGYVASGFHKTGTEVGVKVRGKVRKGVVTKMPFVPSKYWRGPQGEGVVKPTGA